MDPQLVQRSRYLLQARVRRAKTCPPNLFAGSCAQLLAWIRSQPILGPVYEVLLAAEYEFSPEVRALGANDDNSHLYRNRWHVATSNEEHAALCALVVEQIARQGDQDSRENDLLRDLAGYVSGEGVQKLEDIAEVLRDVAVDGLYEFLDERIDSRNAVIGLLRKYRHRCEWFRRHRLRAIARDGLEGKPAGERALAVDLQEYLLDQGIDFVVEPASASGEPDLVLRDVDGSHIVVDAKHIALGSKPSEFKKKIRDGFHQVQRYCSDFQEEAGYLVVFIEDVKAPRLPLEVMDTFEYQLVKGKIVYYVPVVIADLPSASKSGMPEYVDIELSDLELTVEE